jgi:hypothetical protein
MKLDFDKDMKHLLRLIGTCAGVPISPYTIGKVLMRQEHPLGQDVPRELQILKEMLKDGLIQEAYTV